MHTLIKFYDLFVFNEERSTTEIGRRIINVKIIK